jgi:DNA-binding beta-propeller fold protein YncE
MNFTKLLTISWTALFSITIIGCDAQKKTSNVLQLEKSIPIQVKGRIDHLDINLKDQIVYVAALGNNTVEVVDLKAGKVLYSIRGLDEPQGVVYIPQTKEILVANGGTGDCYFYNARSYEKTSSLHLNSDADDVRYDSVSKKVYIGYGDGGIAILDAVTHKQLGNIKLPAHPESFQIDKKLNQLFVNLPDAHMVGVVDLKKTVLIKKWERDIPQANFPMALDSINHRVFVGYRHPARLLIFDAATGKELDNQEMAGDADDLFYDQKSSTVFVSGGDGSVFLFRENGVNVFKQILHLPTRSGARTSLLVPELNRFVLASRADSGKPAELIIYSISQ